MDDLVERARAFVDRHPSSVAPSLPAVVRGLLERIAVLEGALRGLVQAVEMDAHDNSGISGFTGARLSEARASLIREQGDGEQ